MRPSGKNIHGACLRSRGKENTYGRQIAKGNKRGHKRKAQSGEARAKRRRHNYNLRSRSVEFVCEIPCCDNDETRKKYARLGLDSALFYPKPYPVRRKQSHISVVTISSSNDDESMARTAEWVATVPSEIGITPCEEEGLVMDLGPASSRRRGDGETGEICHQLCRMQYPTPQNVSSINQCSFTVSRSPSIYLGSTCTKSTETNSFCVYEPQKCHASEVKASLKPNLFYTNTPDKHTTFMNQGEIFPKCSSISQQIINSKNHNRISIFDPKLPSIQENRPLKLSTTAEERKGSTMVRKSLPFVNTYKNKINPTNEEQRSFCTIIPEIHPNGFQENRPFYSSTPEKEHSFCSIVGGEPDVITGSSSISAHSSIFTNPTKSNLTFGPNHRPNYSLYSLDSTAQAEEELESEKPREFYFGSLKPHYSIGELLSPDVEGSTLVQENSTISSNDGFISGIEKIPDENTESSQISLPQEALHNLAINEPDCSANVDTDQSHISL